LTGALAYNDDLLNIPALIQRVGSLPELLSVPARGAGQFNDFSLRQAIGRDCQAKNRQEENPRLRHPP
jgi:hypothetical protein